MKHAITRIEYEPMDYVRMRAYTVLRRHTKKSDGSLQHSASELTGGSRHLRQRRWIGGRMRGKRGEEDGGRKRSSMKVERHEHTITQGRKEEGEGGTEGRGD